MDVRVVDLEALGRRTPDQVLAYLTAHGWQRVATVSGASYWHNGSAEVVVPLRQGIDSYASYIGAVVSTLGTFEDRSQIDVLTAISQIEFDRQSLRSLVPGGLGTIPIADGLMELEGLQAWFVAAASHLALREKRVVLPSRKPVAAQRLLGQVRLGVPAEGSYIWSILVPLVVARADEPLYGIELGDQDELFPGPRQVTRLLYRATDFALNRAPSVVDSNNYDIRVFQELLPEGLTANLCQAIADLGGESRIPYELSFDWGASLPERPRPVLRAGERQLEVLDSVAKELRASEPVPDVRVEGSVVRLHREGNSGPGEISILGSIVDDASSGLTRYWVSVAEEDYDAASRAHIEGQAVVVEGTYEMQGQRRWLRSASGFEVVSLDDYGE